MTIPEGAILAVSAAAAGAVNSMAGGGTLLSYPALVYGAGFSPRVANVTSTVALWPGAWGAIGGYREDLKGARRLVAWLGAPSLLGGALGAWLLLVTEERTFSYLVPWLVLFATALFAASGRIAKRFGGGGGEGDPRPGPAATAYQFAVAVYGGYFGAGAGILMLALLGAIGMRDIHRMNGVKMFQGLLINVTAIAVFVVAGDLVRWPEAILMAVAACLGGFAGARAAKKVPQAAVRAVVIVAGVAVAGVEFWRAYAR